jgi:hypothetical protein
MVNTISDKPVVSVFRGPWLHGFTCQRITIFTKVNTALIETCIPIVKHISNYIYIVFREYSTETIQMVHNMLHTTNMLKCYCAHTTFVGGKKGQKHNMTKYFSTKMHFEHISSSTIWCMQLLLAIPWIYADCYSSLYHERPKLLANCQKMMGLASQQQSRWQRMC